MNGRRAAIGLSLLCSLVVCAVTAPTASALQGTTAYTCLPVEVGAAFSDEHCTKEAEGGKGWIHQEIPNNTATLLSATNNETLEKTIPSKLKATVEKKLFEVQATGFTAACKENGTRLENKIVGEKKAMKVSGLFCGEFTGVTVQEPKKCSVVKNSIQLEGGIWNGVVIKNPFNGKEAMWLEFVPEAGLPLAKFEVTGGECPIKGKVVEVTGALATEELFPTSALEGATLKFTTKRTGVTLEVEGAKAEFEGTFTPRMLGETEKPTNPITVTTTTP